MSFQCSSDLENLILFQKSVKVIKSTGQKRRRASASSNDSGVDDASSYSKQFVPSQKKGKYPPLELNEEEKRICEREGIKLPSHYPLSREEERNLKRIRRKIRNKVSAQDSRKRKKEYLDNMEDRVRACSDENSELQQRIEQLETQNKTLASQLKRLHNIIVNGGFQTRENKTSTAMMVLLLSTALFLIPGFKDHQGKNFINLLVILVRDLHLRLQHVLGGEGCPHGPIFKRSQYIRIKNPLHKHFAGIAMVGV